MGFVNARLRRSQSLFAALSAGAVFSTSAAEASQCGKASWYKMGTKTASGERMSSSAFAAAHKSLPFGTRVMVENLKEPQTGRGSHQRSRSLCPRPGHRRDQAAAQSLGLIGTGVASVRLTVVAAKAACPALADQLDGRLSTASRRLLRGNARRLAVRIFRHRKQTEPEYPAIFAAVRRRSASSRKRGARCRGACGC